MLKTTALHSRHQALGAKLVDFAGWDMPIHYGSQLEEHHAVRTGCGMFDVAHMAAVDLRGPRTREFLRRLVANDVAKLKTPGKALYTCMLDERGGVIDDLIIYRICDEAWLLIVNAAKIEEDAAWLRSHLPGGVEFNDRSEEYAGLAVQGPQTGPWFEAFFGNATVAPARNGMVRLERKGVPLLIARTGYTGEDGFELFFPAASAEAVFRDVLETAAPLGGKPAGLGARDTLRMEMCYPLNGNDLSPEHTPIEAGLGFFVDLAKADFMGKSVLAEQKASGPARRLAAFKMVGATPPPRSHYGVWKDGQQIGETCSGGLSPSLKLGIGLAYLPAEHAKPGTPIEIDIRGRRFPAVVEKKPLYHRPKKQL